MKKIEYKMMLEKIADLVDGDFCADMMMKRMPHSTEILQEDALKMVDIIGSVYMIAHAVHCPPCQDRYKFIKK